MPHQTDDDVVDRSEDIPADVEELLDDIDDDAETKMEVEVKPAETEGTLKNDVTEELLVASHLEYFAAQLLKN